MKTNHTIYIHASQHMMQIEDNSINLVVTSPPYPMIEMWDEILGEQNPNILESLKNEPEKAFEMMDQESCRLFVRTYLLVCMESQMGKLHFFLLFSIFVNSASFP